MRPSDTTFVLVHGAWHGGWCWDDVAGRLRAKGFATAAPTLTGAAERVGEMTPDVGLDVHIGDVVAALGRVEARRVVLVGHSYAGMVVEGACDRLGDRIGHAVFLDGAAPRDGEAAFPFDEAELVRRFGPLVDGYLLPPPRELTALGLTPGTPLHAAVLARLTPHPLRGWTDRLRLAHGGSAGLARTYVACTPKPSPRPRLAEIRTDPSWRYREVAGAHDIMLTDPAALTALLAEIAEETSHAPASPA